MMQSESRMPFQSISGNSHIKLIIVSVPIRIVLGFLLCGFGMYNTSAFAAPESAGPGLYRDGVKVMDFEELFEDAPSAPHKTGNLSLSSRPAAASSMSGGFNNGANYEIQTNYVNAVMACRDYATSAASGGPRPAESNETLNSLKENLMTRHDALLARLDEITTELEAAGLSAEKLDRHRALIDDVRESGSELVSILTSLSDAVNNGDRSLEDAAFSRLQEYFKDRRLKTEPLPPNTDPLPLPMEITQAQVADISDRPGDEDIPLNKNTTAPSDYDPADLEETIEVQFTQDISDLAVDLDHLPIEMFNYVKENIEFQAYRGSRKGAQHTLDTRRGNDYDQASLLIALLRVSGIPARYAVAERIEMTVEEATNWLGMSDPVEAGALLTTAGFEGVLVYSGPDPVLVWCRRVYVEAWLPYVNYRGAVNDTTGHRWVPLDPAYAQYTYTEGVNLPSEINYDAKSFVELHYSTVRTESPVEMFLSMLIDSLGVYHPAFTEDDLEDRRTAIIESDGILPATLPYEVLTDGARYSEIPGTDRYQIELSVYGQGATVSYSTTIPELVGKQLTISHIGATPADQTIIDNAGGIFEVTTPYLVDVVPEIRVDGCVVATGTGAATMGYPQTFDMYFTTPVGTSNQLPTVSNQLIAGNYIAVGIDPEDVSPSISGFEETECTEDALGQTIHQTALAYLNAVDVNEDRLSGLMHQVITNDVSEAILENQVTVLWSGQPISFTWTGMVVDADRKIIGPFSKDGLDDACDFMRIGGADGSFQENLVFENKFNQDAISTIKILQIASDSGITICEITSSLADCPGISQSASVLNAISNALAIGHHVIIPERSFQYKDWAGTGYIDIDPTTCAAGYIIAGGQNGGATVDQWDIYMPGLWCLQPVGPITVTPAAAGDIYCGENPAHLEFNVPNLIYWGLDENLDCQIIASGPETFRVRYSIREIADLFGGGVYTFSVGSYFFDCDCDLLTKDVTIVRIDFPEDDFLACKDDDKEMTVTVTPSDAPVTFESADPSIATASGTAPTLNIHGVAGGKTQIKGKLNGEDCYYREVSICEIELTECPAGWLPEGREYQGTAVDDPGNSVDFTATLVGGVEAKIKFVLEDVSSEPGVCINFGDESGDTPDLKFIQEGGTNPPATFDAPNADGNEIQTKDKESSATVTVTCYDWGAWGKIKACCVDDDGDECKFTDPENIPVDDVPAGGNHIADSWQPAHAAEAAGWDDDDFPSGMERNGDGFTFYEEYRGTMNGTSAGFTSHDRHNPEHKDLFLYDPDDLHLLGHNEHQYGLETSILIQYLDADPAKLMNGTGTRVAGHREVTWKSEFSHTQDQYALHVHRQDTGGRASWGVTPADPAGAPIGPPNTALDVQIDDAQVATDLSDAITDQGGDPAGAEQAAFEDVRDRQITTTMTHEMGHATDVTHHSAADGGRQSPYGGNYSGEIVCFMRYDFDLVDDDDAAHPNMYGIRDSINSPDPPTPPGTPSRFKFSNYTDKDLSDLTPVLNTFCTSDNNCKGQIDVKDP